MGNAATTKPNVTGVVPLFGVHRESQTTGIELQRSINGTPGSA